MASLLDVVMMQRNPQMAGLLGIGQRGATPGGSPEPAVQQTTPAPAMPTVRQVQPNIPDLFGADPAQQTAPTATPEAPPEQQSRGFIARLFAGDPVPGLSKEQNRSLRQQALLQAGLTILAQPNANALQALAMGVLQARQATAQTAGALLDEQRAQARAMQRAAVFENSELTEIQKWEEILRIANREGDVEQQKVVKDVLADLRAHQSQLEGKEYVEVNGQTFLTDTEGNLYEPGTGRPITEAVQPKRDLPSDLEGILAVLDVDMDSLDPTQRSALFNVWEQFREKSATRVNVDARDPIVEGIDQIGLDRLAKATESAENASATLSMLGQVEDLLADTPTGKLEAAALPLRQLAAQFGLPTDAGPQETLRALSNQMALLARQNMPGALSDNDIKFLTQQVVSLSNTPDANRRIIEISRAVAEHQALRAAEIERYIAQHKTGVGLNEHMRKWDEEQRGKASRRGGGAAAPAARQNDLRSILRGGN